jgi:dihydroxyacid dehydratase/phosphogluconate dehydratase
VPVIANIRPSGDKYLMEDFYYAGGLLALMTRLRPHLDLNQMNAAGQTWDETLRGVSVYNEDVIRPLNNPIYGTPARRAIASKWMTALVEQPMAIATAIAFL